MSSKICHVVLFSLNKARLQAAFPSESDLQRQLQSIRANVPGVLEIQMGPAASALYEGYVMCNGEYTHCLVSKHLDAEALRMYVTHPVHVAFAQQLVAASEKPLTRIDFEIKE
ncbi:Stress responsive alpha-beta barrel [Trypanosoma melophagium]|uniref:Stress responsive alpha-beta barrel n=1 Tax=Trypanosoma melophagium TaxID=715481 RepID=UPI00351AB031|nr:Stress responsive alpha-beta barrel [Trypanosoma melophagium]